MPPLKNIKHERLAHAILTAPSNTKAYLQVYQNSSEAAARSSVPEILAKPCVRNRIQELLEQKNCGLPRITERFSDFLNDTEDKALSWDAVKTGLKIFGAFDNEDTTKNMQNINISVVKITAHKDTNNSQVIDIQADRS